MNKTENDEPVKKLQKINVEVEDSNQKAVPKTDVPNSTEKNEHNNEAEQNEDFSESKDGGLKKDSTEFSSLVAAHYNSVLKQNCIQRNESRIIYMRNFNNWIKSLLIKDGISELPDSNIKGLKVLDMCCGKGGDFLKWMRSNVKYMVCTDIAETCIDEYKGRYNDNLSQANRSRRPFNLDCEFIPADCTRVRLRTKYRDPSIHFDIVSCQFSFHYCFESLPQAECMLKNATECLKTGGVFIGTIPNANEIVKRLVKSNSNSFSNEVYSLEMCCERPYPLFGAKYNFYLEGVVNCPEFLVHFPTFVRLAEKYGLELVRREKFQDFFEKKKNSREGQILLKKIKALEPYPPGEDKNLAGPISDYSYAEAYCKSNSGQQIRTLSKSEWEVITLYQTFIFRKVDKNN